MEGRPVSKRDWDDAHLINAAIDIHHDDPEFGYRFITDELAAQVMRASRNRVNRLCTSQRLWSVRSRKRGLSRKPEPPVHDDLVRREFTAPSRPRASSTSARSRTPAPSASSATPSTSE